ncbi:L-threonylcarbamoyladenylate synthase [Malassezia cuniculi]|uniref:Threonylcarbamoyl-AMP synthase n=1 Tax=Malassezia cuniculi TaxID=948313 RepID=A0AAF0ERA8_9BASI|nr:L-threonylcarbamoyladenylate synthase [Malassezia cuniculi]
MSDQKRDESSSAAPLPGAGRFVEKKDTIEDALKMETVGLVRLEDFQKKREELMEHKKRETQKREQQMEEKRNKRRKELARSVAALSFSAEEEIAPPPRKRREKSVRNPEVDTSFLPDREREEAERREREELREEWHARQAELKKEAIHVEFDYWDGSAHAAAVDSTKGEAIGAFLERCKAQVSALKQVPADRLMYIKVRTLHAYKDELIVPNHYSFYDLISREAQGRNGVLFQFEKQRDGPDTDKAACGKVVDRQWYQKNKHIYPASLLPIARRSIATGACFDIEFAEGNASAASGTGASREPLQHATVKFASATTTASIEKAAAHLRAGELVAFPTETVYGLGANALSADSVRKIYAAKNRPADNPLIVHVSDMDMLRTLVPREYTLNPVCSALAEAFWPGPLTLLFPVGGDDVPAVPQVVTCGQPTVGVRIPAHPVARALIATARIPVAAPSANASGRPSPTTAQHVVDDLGKKGAVEYVLDGGACSVGVESTVIDAVSTPDEVRILRPGGVTVEHVMRTLADKNLLAGPGALPGARRLRVFGKDLHSKHEEQNPTTPGMKYRHYSPDARVLLVKFAHDGDALVPLLTQHLAGVDTPRIGLMCAADSHLMKVVQKLTPQLANFSCGGTQLSDIASFSLDGKPAQLCVYSLGADSTAEGAARHLFDGLRTLDSMVPWAGEESACHVILVEAIDEHGVGLAVMNRLNKAASSTITVASV